MGVRRFLAIGIQAFLAFGVAQPSPRAYVDMVYDSESELFVLFGGQNDHQLNVNAETWVFDPGTAAWEQRFPNPVPPPRGAYALAYDEQSDRVVLFSGMGPDGLQYDDLWSYDANTNTWTLHEPASDDAPSGRNGGRMAYDAESYRMVLFGGFDWSERSLLADTWILDLDSATWTEITTDPSPPPRNFHQIAYDRGTDHVYLWGGDIRPFSDWGVLWSFDANSNTWSSYEKVNRPVSVYYGRLISLPGRDQLLLYGGGPTGSDAMWIYDPEASLWSEVAAEGPGKRATFAMAADEESVYLFGGELDGNQEHFENDLWRFDLDQGVWERL